MASARESGINQPFERALLIRRCIAVALVSCVVNLTACSTVQERPKVNVPPVSPTSSVSAKPTPPADIYRACGGNPYDPSTAVPYRPDGPAYSGSGIHPTILYKVEEYGIYEPEDKEPMLPNEWLPPDQRPDLPAPQLIVCEYPDWGYQGRTVDTCTYEWTVTGETFTVEIKTALYIYRVFEAKTGKMISEFSLEGTVNLTPTCPNSTRVRIPVIRQVVGSASLIEKLRPLVVT